MSTRYQGSPGKDRIGHPLMLESTDRTRFSRRDPLRVKEIAERRWSTEKINFIFSVRGTLEVKIKDYARTARVKG